MDSTRTTIGDFEYELTPLPAGRALKVLTRLARMAGPALGDIMEARKGLQKGDETAAAKAIRTLTGTLQDGDLEYLIENVLGDHAKIIGRDDRGNETRRPLTKANADEHFRGRLGDLFKLLWVALRGNFGDFLGALAAKSV